MRKDWEDSGEGRADDEQVTEEERAEEEEGSRSRFTSLCHSLSRTEDSV